jgi:hypothetical protein
MNKRIKRLKLGTADASELSDALDRVIDQPASASKGNHAALVYAMKRIFGINLNKGEAVEGALYALWREGDLMQIESSDAYIWELQKSKRNEAYWIERADAE